jgi:hypothetical protein
MIRQNPSPRVTLLLWTAGTLLFILAETLAVGIIIRNPIVRAESHSFQIYLLPLLVGLPWLAGVTSNAKIRKRQLMPGTDQNVWLGVSHAFAILVVFANVGLIGTLSILAFNMVSIHQLLGR